jgi:transcriptional regulator with XRE-family HTH domain
MSLGENIREKRKALGLTQEELGEALGMAPQTVSKWERDESLPDAALLPQLADALGCSLDRLFGRQTREYMDAATAARDWLLGVRREDRWTEALRLGRIMQTVLAGFWELPGTVSIEAYDDPRGVTGLVHSDEGYSLSAWGKKALPYLLLFPEPGEGWGPYLRQDDPGFWQALAKEPVREALRRLYAGEFPHSFDRSWAVEKGALTEETLADLIKLGALNVHPMRINGADSEFYYSDYPLCLLTVLLMSTVRKDTALGFSSYGRRAPFLRTREEE